MVTFKEPKNAGHTTQTCADDESGHGGEDYYKRGSKELATETALTLERLEARRKLTKNAERLVIVLVGLPARGKSFLGRKLMGFFNWRGVECKVFNVGKYRRQAQAGSSCDTADADFFDSNNTQAAALRERVAEIALLDMLEWLDDDADDNYGEAPTSLRSMNPDSLRSERCTGSGALDIAQIRSVPDTATPHQVSKHERVAIFDATNSTDKRRQWVLEMCTSPEKRRGKPTGCVFVESICDDEELLLENFKQKIANSPDYRGIPETDAIEDLKQRVQKYEEQYETIADDKLSYIKIFNLSTKMLVNHIYGRMSKIIMPAMMAWNIGTRPVFLCRPGQTLASIATDGEDYVAKVQHNLDVLDLSRSSQRTLLQGYHLGPAGRHFSNALYEFVSEECTKFLITRASIMDMKYTGTSKTGLATPQSKGSRSPPFPLQVYTSTMPRATETVRWDEQYDFDVEEMSNLNPLDKGDFGGKELEDIKSLNPTFYRKLEKDAFHTRFPGGESYFDLINRLDSVIVDLEQQVTPTLVVSHVSVLQMLIAYFRNSPVKNCMDIEVPLHAVMKFTPARGGGWSESVHQLSPAEEDTPMLVPEPEAESKNNLQAKTTGVWPFQTKPAKKSAKPLFGGHKGVSPTSVLDARTHGGSIR